MIRSLSLVFAATLALSVTPALAGTADKLRETMPCFAGVHR